MTEYIEREAIQKRLNRIVEVNNLRTDLAWFTPYGVKDLIEEIPAADVRPVITCGECKHWFENGTDYCSCDRDALLRERDFFCAAGEKREES